MARLPKNWKALDIEAFRSKARNRVYRIGIELEGGWDVLPPGVRLQHDGSIDFDKPIRHVGEWPIGPLDLVKDSPMYWVKALTVAYPQHVNETCGMHVHLSFKTAFAYNRLMMPQYPATVVAAFSAWATKTGLSGSHPIWHRLEGLSRYCQFKFDADNQVLNGEKDHDQRRVGHRYTVINYCYGRYNTIECRLLPMMETAKQAVSAIQELVDVTNAFLLAVPIKREPKQRTEHVVEDSMDITETRIHV